MSAIERSRRKYRALDEDLKRQLFEQLRIRNVVCDRHLTRSGSLPPFWQAQDRGPVCRECVAARAAFVLKEGL